MSRTGRESVEDFHAESNEILGRSSASQEVNNLERTPSQAARQHSLPNSNTPPSTSPTASSPVCNSIEETRAERWVRPNPSQSPSMSAIDPNNNKNAQESSSARADSSSGFRRSNFSKSASGSRLSNRPNTRPNVCDCLAQNCDQKEHSNRRQFIEHYYNSRTRLPTASAISSININTPLSSLNECDAITKRLLSSPIRTTNLIERPCQREQANVELDKSRRASLGTNTMTDQVFLFSSNQFKSLESDQANEELSNEGDNRQKCDPVSSDTSSASENGIRLKQQQGRSLSVCNEETLKPRYRKTNNSNHSSILNRAVSLACESGSSKCSLTIIPLFGCDIEALGQFARLGLILPPPIDSAIDYILYNGTDAVGIFRKSGVKSRILSLRQRIEANQDARITDINSDNEFSIYDIADLVKMWFRELRPAPLMNKVLIKLVTDYLQGNNEQCSRHMWTDNSSQLIRSESKGSASDSNRVSENLKKRIDSILPTTHRALFSKALDFFASIASKSEVNQMSSQNLAICLTPSLCATESDQNSISTAQKALEYCIDNYRMLF